MLSDAECRPVAERAGAKAEGRELGCRDIEVFASSIAGGDGNVEFFLGAKRG